MQQIAEETGGKAYFNTDAIGEVVGEAMAHGSSYYTVGYVPELKKFDGTYHRLKIAMDGGLDVSYRHGYFADDLTASNAQVKDAKEALRDALQPWTPPVSDLLFKVRVLPVGDALAAAVRLSPDPGGGLAKSPMGPSHRYVIAFGVAADQLALPPNANGDRHARLEFGVVAYDRNGRRLNYADKSVDIRLTPALYERVTHDGIPFRQEIDLPLGQSLVRIMVRDLDSVRLGVLEVPVSAMKR